MAPYEYLEELGISLYACDGKVTVSGLKAETYIAINDYISVVNTGFDGRGRVEIVLDRDALFAAVNEVRMRENPDLVAEESDSSEFDRCINTCTIFS
jgi:hypothetical protein